MNRAVVASILGAALIAACGGWQANAQDTRTVTEPAIPVACTVLQAGQAIVAGEPASETAFDTTRIQNALNASVSTCGTGYSVELTTSGSNNAFLIGPLTIPADTTLVIDGGVTVFGSRNPADYQVATTGVETCGTVGTKGNGCLNLVTSSGNNSGLMGYGILDGRGQDKLLVNGTPASYSWWDQAGTAQNVSGSQNNPILVQASGANFTLYKITVRNSPMFHVKWSGNVTTRTGFTAWGVKVITPFTARNSDGIDPSGGNITVTNSSISDGDDMVAVSAASAAQNITIQNLNTYSGHGISVGSYTQGNLSNMLVQNIMQMGTAADGNGGGLRIKTSQDRGGLVQNVTYQNICSANVKSPIYLSPYYNTNAGTLYPNFQNIVYRNIHVVTEGTITLTGYANTGATVIQPASVTFDNLIIDTIKQTDFSPNPPVYLNITRGPGPVSPLLLSQTGTGDTYSGAVTNPTEAPYACNPAMFQYLVGELYGATPTATNLQSTSITTNGTLTLNAMLQPAMSQVTYASISGQGSYTGTAAPTAQVQFREGTNVVGTASLGGNGTIASVTLSGLTAGTHTYTAYYAGDTTYTVPLTFGSVTVTVAQASPTTTALNAAPASVTYGTASKLTANVTSTASGTPSGSIVFVDNGATGSTSPAQLATVTLTGAAASTPQVLGVGSHNLQAIYSGDSSFAASTSTSTAVTVTQAAPAVSIMAGSASIAYGATATLTATVAPAGTGSNPTGTVVFYDGTTAIASGILNGAGVATATITPTGGSHTYTATYAGDTNYATATTPNGAAVAVSTASTTTTLALSGSTAYGSTTTLSATVTSTVAGTPTGTVTFYAGTVAVGSATVTAGKATITAVLPQGSNSLTAKYAGDANFATSTSTATTFTLVGPFAVSSNPSSLSLGVGATGTATISITPAGGFTGTVTLACASPASYITCTVSPATQTISSASAVTGTVNIAIASTISSATPPAELQHWKRDTALLAMLLPLSLVGWRKRRMGIASLLPVLLACVAIATIAGCASQPANVSNTPPAGTQAVTITATSGTVGASTTINVTITH